MEFQLMGTALSISEGRKNYMKVLTYYKAMASQAEVEFKQEYENNFGLVFLNSTYVERFKKTYGSDGYMDGIVRRYVTKTRQFLTNFGVYTLSDMEIWREAVLEKGERNISNFQEHFNSFIVEALLDDNYEYVEDSVFISRIKAKFNTNFFPSKLRYEVLSLCDYVLNYLNDNGVAAIEFVYKKDSAEAEAIYKNLLDSNIPEAEQLEYARSLIRLDPRNKDYYECIFKKFPQSKFEIAAIARYLSIDISELIEKDIRASFFLNLISSEEDALKMMDELTSVMSKYGVESSSRKTELEKILKDYDIKARTYENTLYDTRAQRAQAENDDHYLMELCGDVSAITKEECQRISQEISNGAFALAIKEKHMAVLSNRIDTLEKEYLKSLTVNLEEKTEEECEALKLAIAEYDGREKNKQEFLAQVDKRIYAIWDKEDYNRFFELYLNTSANNPNQVETNAGLVDTEGRTESKKLFVEALKVLNTNNVQVAAKYILSKEKGGIASLGGLGKEGMYKKLTLDGTVIHPDIEAAVRAIRQEKEATKGKGILGMLGKKKAGDAVTTQRYCSACGGKLDGIAKFCPSCGKKID